MKRKNNGPLICESPEENIVYANTAGDVYSKLVEERIIFLKDEIDATVATKISATLFWLNSQSQTEEIILYINSPGGTVSDGLFTIYDTLQFIKAPVKTICIGEASSSAAVILAAGSKGRRFAYPSARIMIHNIQVSEMSGSQTEIEKESKRIKELNDNLIQTIARHTGQLLRKVKRDCINDKYLTAEQAVAYGIIDGIIQPNKEIPELLTKTIKSR